jgi:hypothetical protein
MSPDKLLDILPPVNNKKTVIVGDQDVDDIMKEVLNAHAAFRSDYDLICGQYAGGSVEKRLYDFCKKNFQYRVEDGELQTTKSPAVMLKTRRCDCKGYAGFIAGILDALNRAGAGNYNWYYRFCYYKDKSDDTWHVFVVVKQVGGGEIWIDPVLSGFNKRTPAPMGAIDKKVTMSLQRLSGAPAVDMRAPVRIVAGNKSSFCDCAPLGGYKTIGAVSQFTPQQLGIPIGQNAFNLQNLTPGAADAIAQNPPYQFWDGDQQIALPPVVTVGGQAVPPLPANLHIRWAPSFMGVPIPADMLNVANNNGALVISPQQINSTGGAAQTTNLLWANNKVLAFLMDAVLENLIYSYASWPWGNQYGDLSQYLHDHRDYDNWLYYPFRNRGTFFQDVVKVAAPIAGLITNLIVPGAGGLVSAGLTAAAGKSNTQGPNTIIPGYQEQTAAPVSSGLQLPPVAQQVTAFAQANPMVTVGILGAVSLLLYEIFKSD